MSLFLNNWRQLFSPAIANVLLVFVSMLCGAIIGIEREKKKKPAGLRTMCLVSLGSTVFTILSVTVEGEPGRIAAQVIAGIGFLGAGSILHGTGTVRGITTAATIWACAAVGMVIGAGYPFAGIGLTACIFVVVGLVSVLEMRYLGPCTMATAGIFFDSAQGKASIKVDDILDEYQIPTDARLKTVTNEMVQIRFSYCNAHKHHKELLPRLAAIPEVVEIQQNPP
ncbi:MAG: MgtC/SapB family protein [Deltaproteobacteria bacterium]|nr:MgtC/SapB family protein [Deltaproteobacteria bacterium]